MREKNLERQQEVYDELRKIDSGDLLRRTLIPHSVEGMEPFDHEEWIEAERKALVDRQARIEQTMTVHGKFAGLDE